MLTMGQHEIWTIRKRSDGARSISLLCFVAAQGKNHRTAGSPELGRTGVPVIGGRRRAADEGEEYKASYPVMLSVGGRVWAAGPSRGAGLGGHGGTASSEGSVAVD